MVELWFAIAAVTVTLYVIADGFDLGAGALHLVVARTDRERRQVLAAIGPARRAAWAPGRRPSPRHPNPRP